MQITTICNSSSRRSNAIFWPLWVPEAHKEGKLTSEEYREIQDVTGLPDLSTTDSMMEVPFRPNTQHVDSTTCQSKNKDLIHQSPYSSGKVSNVLTLLFSSCSSASGQLLLLTEAYQPRTWFLCLKAHLEKGSELPWDSEHPE